MRDAPGVSGWLRGEIPDNPALHDTFAGRAVEEREQRRKAEEETSALIREAVAARKGNQEARRLWTIRAGGRADPPVGAACHQGRISQALACAPAARIPDDDGFTDAPFGGEHLYRWAKVLMRRALDERRTGAAE